MKWKIIFPKAFRDWLYEQEEKVQDSILASIGLLKQEHLQALEDKNQ